VRSYTRHQLKQDAFTTSTAETISWAVENRSTLIAAGTVVAVILAILVGGWAFIQYRDQQARQQLATAIQQFNEPIRPAGTPATPDEPSFASNEERGKTTNAEFVRIADKYSHTQSAAMARYFAGITYRDMGDTAAAEKSLEDVSSSRYSEIASLAKLALASVYHDAGKNPQAVDVYKQLIDHPTVSVGKSTAQFALASLYQSMSQPDQARHLYEQMAKESPGTLVAQMASQRLQELGKQ
jgi:predicted negative regulator of RcsB-dependent stress response